MAEPKRGFWGSIGQWVSENPHVALGAGTTGVGLLQGLLQGNAQRSRYNRFESRLNAISSPEHLERLTTQEKERRANEFSSIARAERMGASAAATRTRARFSRAGLTGVGESMGQVADVTAFFKGRETATRLSAEAAKMAMEQRAQEMRALQALMGTPYGDVSPASAMIAGAGSGLEAAVNAAYANNLAGRGGND